MSIRFVLFDLDGTLLPMDQEVFVNAYFGRLAAKLAPLGYEPQALIDGIWKGTAAMVQNDGSCSNEEAFWNRFAQIFGEQARADEPTFDAFYREDFQQVQSVCGFAPEAAQIVAFLKEKGLTLALATNPIFPAVATESRMRWAGLDKEDFALYTTYENSCHCKPNPDYYRDVLAALDAQPQECLMVGNDVEEDMVAATLGMQVFLLTDCLINKYSKDISQFPNGDFKALLKYVQHI
ncbi:MAG: HAD family hydrolase [Oscillospiraceae bacterium]|nr:HAD family hydrolase [Oscillospiraceae bacterium]